MTNSHYESVVIQRGSLASCESVFICQHMHALRHKQEPPIQYVFICFSSEMEHYFQGHSVTSQQDRAGKKWVFINRDLSNITSCTFHRSPGNHPCYCKTHFIGTIVLLLLYFRHTKICHMSASAVWPDTLTHIVKKKALMFLKAGNMRGRKTE